MGLIIKILLRRCKIEEIVLSLDGEIKGVHTHSTFCTNRKLVLQEFDRRKVGDTTDTTDVVVVPSYLCICTCSSSSSKIDISYEF